MAASPLHHSGAWALVFDGGRAILFENRGGDRTPELHMVATLENPVPPTRMLGRDRPGRFATPTGGRTAVESTDHHDAAEAAFVRAVAGLVEGKADAFTHLVVIAPPRLHHLLSMHAPAVATRIIAYLAHDYTGHGVEDITQGFLRALDQQRSR
ncbi:MAG: host attachment protein [Sphingomonadales bacterium]|nr:MAG: host attachment protein [Sphingomonadales bacterium]